MHTGHYAPAPDLRCGGWAAATGAGRTAGGGVGDRRRAPRGPPRFVAVQPAIAHCLDPLHAKRRRRRARHRTTWQFWRRPACRQTKGARGAAYVFRYDGWCIIII